MSFFVATSLRIALIIVGLASGSAMSSSAGLLRVATFFSKSLAAFVAVMGAGLVSWVWVLLVL